MFSSVTEFGSSKEVRRITVAVSTVLYTNCSTEEVTVPDDFITHAMRRKEATVGAEDLRAVYQELGTIVNANMDVLLNAAAARVPAMSRWKWTADTEDEEDEWGVRVLEAEDLEQGCVKEVDEFVVDTRQSAFDRRGLPQLSQGSGRSEGRGGWSYACTSCVVRRDYEAQRGERSLCSPRVTFLPVPRENRSQ